jgi:hypothetical protein
MHNHNQHSTNQGGIINHHHHHPPPQLMYEVLADQTMWAVCGRTAGIVSLEVVEKQSVTLDVMPLTSGFLPLPVVRLSRYIPAVVEMKNGNHNLCLYNGFKSKVLNNRPYGLK